MRKEKCWTEGGWRKRLQEVRGKGRTEGFRKQGELGPTPGGDRQKHGQLKDMRWLRPCWAGGDIIYYVLPEDGTAKKWGWGAGVGQRSCVGKPVHTSWETPATHKLTVCSRFL